jgi:hypothetical protein
VYSPDRVLNETILGVNEVHAEAGEANPLRRRSSEMKRDSNEEKSIVHIPHEAEL